MRAPYGLKGRRRCPIVPQIERLMRVVATVLLATMLAPALTMRATASAQGFGNNSSMSRRNIAAVTGESNRIANASACSSQAASSGIAWRDSTRRS